MCPADLQNPFSLEPIKMPAQFLGREQETRRTLQFLHRGQCVSIVGPARIGKTSFLFHVADPQVRAQYQFARDHVFVYLDCRSLANSDQNQCYLFILEETIRQVRDMVNGAIRAELEKAAREQELRTPFQRLHDLFRSARANHVKLTMVLDDYEFLAGNRRLKDNFFSKSLRSLSHYLTYLVASESQLEKLERILDDTSPDDTSPFFNIFGVVNLGALNPQESRGLVLALLGQIDAEFPQSTIDCILELGNDEPYRLQKAGHIAFQVWQAGGGPLQAEHCVEIRRRFAIDEDHAERP